MTNLLRRLSLALVVVLAWSIPSAAQTADEVIEKGIAAMGGRAAFARIKSRMLTGTVSIETPVGAIPGTVEILNAVPNKGRTLIKADLSAFGAGPLVVDQRFDGTNGYVLDTMQGNRDITGSQLENLKANSFPHPFLNYKEMGMSVTLGAKEKIGERDALQLVFEPTTGTPVRQYVDAETFLPLRTVIIADIPQMGTMEQTIDASDSRVLDGIQVPFTLRISTSVQTVTLTFTKIEHNVAVDETLFVKPQ